MARKDRSVSWEHYLSVMLSLAQGFLEELSDRNMENKKDHLNKLVCCTLSKYPALAILQQLQE